MAIPEQTILSGVTIAWRFLKERLAHHIGYFASEYPLSKQEEFIRLLREDNPAIFVGQAEAVSRLPAFIVIPGSESEEWQFVGNQGASNLEPLYLADTEGLEEVDPLAQVTYPSDGDLQPLKMYIDGLQGSKGPRNISPRRKNLRNMKEPSSVGDEQYQRLGWIQRLWDRDGHRLFETVVGDHSYVEVQVLTETAEKTNLYARLLRWVLRRFNVWFHVNGLYNIRFDLTGLMQMDLVQPTVSVGGPWQRTIQISFNHFDRAIEVETTLFEWILEMELAAPRPDGGLDILPLTVTDK